MSLESNVARTALVLSIIAIPVGGIVYEIQSTEITSEGVVEPVKKRDLLDLGVVNGFPSSMTIECLDLPHTPDERLAEVIEQVQARINLLEGKNAGTEIVKSHKNVLGNPRLAEICN